MPDSSLYMVPVLELAFSQHSHNTAAYKLLCPGGRQAVFRIAACTEEVSGYGGPVSIYSDPEAQQTQFGAASGILVCSITSVENPVLSIACMTMVWALQAPANHR